MIVWSARSITASSRARMLPRPPASSMTSRPVSSSRAVSDATRVPAGRGLAVFQAATPIQMSTASRAAKRRRRTSGCRPGRFGFLDRPGDLEPASLALNRIPAQPRMPLQQLIELGAGPRRIGRAQLFLDAHALVADGREVLLDLRELAPPCAQRLAAARLARLSRDGGRGGRGVPHLGSTP